MPRIRKTSRKKPRQAGGDEKTINIGGKASDEEHRYKMRPLATKVEGRGNGIKTILVNVQDVADDLRTEAQYITKFFGLELGAQTVSKKDKPHMIRGQHSRTDLQRRLETFVNEFILCPSCRDPELEWRVIRSRYYFRCAACGDQNEMATQHRLKQFIINHPPERQRAPSARLDDSNGLLVPSCVAAESDGTWSTQSGLESVAHSIHAQMLSVVNMRDCDDRDGEKRRGREKKVRVDVLSSLRSFIRATNGNVQRSVEEVCFEIDRIVTAHELDRGKEIRLIFEAVLDLSVPRGERAVVEEVVSLIERWSALFEKFTQTERDVMLFVGCLEEMVMIRYPSLSENPVSVCKVWQSLYECGVLEEQDIVDWFHSDFGSSWLITRDDSRRLRGLVSPFVEWLEHSSREDDGEE